MENIVKMYFNQIFFIIAILYILTGFVKIPAALKKMLYGKREGRNDAFFIY